jgi:hypothetical protein
MQVSAADPFALLQFPGGRNDVTVVKKEDCINVMAMDRSVMG